MWRRSLAPLCFLALLAPNAQAQDATQELLNQISHDIESLSVNTVDQLAEVEQVMKNLSTE